MLIRGELLVALLLIAGCSANSTEVDDLVHTKDQDANRHSVPVTAVRHSRPYDYPHPERTNPFAMPEGVQPVLPGTERKTSSLQVRGFVDVGRLRVVLVDTTGQTYVLGEGDSKNDIRVEKIEPPKVAVSRNGESVSLELAKP